MQSQKNNWPQAEQLLTQVIIENPDKPDALYDLGVVAYKNNNFDTALNYFNKAASHPMANSMLQQQAHFNAGNAHVQLKQLQEAIDAYDNVLALKPDHKEALHNKEMVKKMMEENKQEQKKDNQNKNEEQNDQTPDNKEDSSDDQKEQDSQNKQNQDKKSTDDNQPSPKGSGGQESMADKQQNKKQNQDKKEKKSGSEYDQKDQKPDQSNADKSNESEPEKQKKSGEQENQQSSKEKKGTQDPVQSADANQSSSIGSSSQKPLTDKKLSAGLARALEEREKKDAQLNKKMTKALVANQGGGKNDYNCW
ncbi:MAG: hypothetical protein AMXMBFR12_09340 [Candidatus Babeliales bacterium]